MDEVKVVPLWLLNLLFCNVFPDVMEYLSGVCGSTGFKTGSNVALDI